MKRFIRLETMWDASPWLDVLSAEAQLVWIKLLCYVKGHGWNGAAKALSPITAARMWNVGDESVRQLLKAAEMHGAIDIENGDWVINKWGEYQGDVTGAERQRRFKDKQSNGGNALSVVSNTEKEKEKDNISPPTPSSKRGMKPPSLQEVLDYGQSLDLPPSESQKFHDHGIAIGWKVGKNPMKDWKAALRTWKANWLKWNPVEEKPKRKEPQHDLVPVPFTNAEGMHDTVIVEAPLGTLRDKAKRDAFCNDYRLKKGLVLL